MKMNLRFQTAAAACALLLAAAPGHAAETYFTRSSDFAAATS